jgi:hypothetical protein
VIKVGQLAADLKGLNQRSVLQYQRLRSEKSPSIDSHGQHGGSAWGSTVAGNNILSSRTFAME